MAEDMKSYSVIVKDEVTQETLFAKVLKRKSKRDVLLHIIDKLGDDVLDTKGIIISISHNY